MMVARPNILFLFSDQHRADALGCAGHPVVKTPNLDRLAAEGVRFENVRIAGAPLDASYPQLSISEEHAADITFGSTP